MHDSKQVENETKSDDTQRHSSSNESLSEENESDQDHNVNGNTSDHMNNQSSDNTAGEQMHEKTNIPNIAIGVQTYLQDSNSIIESHLDHPPDSHELNNENSESRSIGENDADDDVPIIPLVEWVYPGENNSSFSELENERRQRRQRNRRSDINNPEEYVVDPSQIYVTLEVEGRVITPRRYFLKMFGFVLCSDEYPGYFNPKSYPMIIVFLCGIILAIYFSVQNISNTMPSDEPSPFGSNLIESIPSTKPSLTPSYAPIDPRVANITKFIHEMSGNAALIDGSSQSRALAWLLHDDELNLAYDSPRIIQRYAMMVLYYSLQGESWTEKDLFASNVHECAWKGVECAVSFEIGGIIIDGNNLRGQLPSEIALLSRLQVLSLMQNSLTGSIPSEIGRLKWLETLRLNHNSLTSGLPKETANCRALSVLRLHNNLMTGMIPSFLGNMRSLQKIFLNDNQFSRRIPSELGKLRSLTELSLSSNRLTGTIPTEIAQIKFIENLQLWDNNLNGTIPTEFVNLSDLKELAVLDNSLSGTIPSLLYELPKLTDLILSSNLFTGTIPTFSASSPNMEFIHFSNTRINGTIPESFSNFPRLAEISFHSTELSGTVPVSLCSLSLTLLTADCAGTLPKVICSCCTECY